MGQPPNGPVRRSLGLVAAALVLGFGSVVYRRTRPAPPPPADAPAEEPSPSEARVKLPFDLVEASQAAGVVFRHQEFGAHPSLANVQAWISSVGVGTAAADVDGDGRPDIFVTNTAKDKPNALFLNRGDGTFKESAAAWGLADLNDREFSTRPLFVDIDNDGDRDLVLATTYCMKVLVNEGRRFVPAPQAAGLDYCGVVLATNALDYDGDGDLDLVVAGYFPSVDFSSPTTTSFMQNSLTEATNGGLTILFENDGKGRFRRVTGEGVPGGRHWTNAVGVWDFDDDGRPDLFFATDYNEDRVYLNRGGGRFEDVSSALAHKYSRSGMNADVAEPFQDGRPAVFVTHIFEPPYKIGPNTMWTWTGGKSPFVDLGKESGAGTCGWAWAGRFVDLDSDGYEDLVVTNGYISADPHKSYWYRMSVLTGASREVIADARNWPPFGDYSMSGYQRKCVFLNDGRQMRLVTRDTGMRDDLSDGRTVSVLDPLSDGKPALVMGNQNQPLKYYRLVAEGERSWVGFSLRGTRSNADAWGTRVRVRLGGRTLTRRLWPANSFMSQSDGRLFFGLGGWKGPVEAEVRWPSGTVQKLEGLAPGRYHALVEPR